MSNKSYSSPEPSHTIDDFCRLESIARGSLYNMWKAGTGPRRMNIGATVRITEKARQDWHREREAEAGLTKRGGDRTEADAMCGR